VGSGLTGLIAATELEEAGLNVKVLEAADRIGGKMYSKDLSDTQSVDYGGQWIGTDHTELMKLCDDLGITFFPVPSAYRTLTQEEIDDPTRPEDVGLVNGPFVSFTYGGRNYRPSTLAATAYDAWKFGESEIPEDVQADLANCLRDIYTLLGSFPEGGYPHELGDEWKFYDDMTVDEWFRTNTETDLGYFLCNQLGPSPNRINGGTGPAEPEASSMLNFLWSMTNSPPSQNPEAFLINGAAGQIPPRLAEKLDHPVAVSDPVVAIEQTKNAHGKIQAKVIAASGKTYKAKNVLVAMSPYMSGRIDYSPGLPWKRHQLNQHKPKGTVAKMLLEYPTRFWDDVPDQGGRLHFVDKGSGMLSFMGDCTDNRSSQGHWVILITGEQYDMFAAYESEEERKQAVLQELAGIYGEAALYPDSFDMADWPANKWVQGSYAAYWPPQAWTRFGEALIKPHGVIQWASTETALKWDGYFEGCIREGKRAARDILDGKIGDLPEKIFSGDYVEL